MKNAISVTDNRINLKYTVFEYAYIDGSNYKAFGEVWLSGTASRLQIREFMTKLESGQFFVAEQIGIPPLYEGLFEFSGGVTPDDHGWHTFVEFRKALQHDLPNKEAVWGSVNGLVSSVQQLTDWEPSLSANFESCEAV